MTRSPFTLTTDDCSRDLQSLLGNDLEVSRFIVKDEVALPSSPLPSPKSVDHVRGVSARSEMSMVIVTLTLSGKW